MNLEEKVKIILSLGNRVLDKSKLTREEKDLLLRTYKEATGERKKENCGSCFVEIYLYFNKLKTNTMERLFRLKEGKTIYFKSDVIMKKGKLDNLTDQKALEMLKENADNLRHFEVYPENWQELVSSYDPLKSVKEKRSGIKVEIPKREEPKSAEPDVIKIKREALETKKLPELKNFLANRFNSEPEKYPKKEWFILNKEKTIDYIISKS